MTDLILPDLEFIRTIPLKHAGDCSLLGVTPDQRIFAEEIHGSDGWLARHSLTWEGEWIASVDESNDALSTCQPATSTTGAAAHSALDLPEGTVTSASGWQTMWLNFAGPRHRGLRVLERIDAMVRPFSVQDRLRLSDHPALKLPPHLVLGLAESYVLRETPTAVLGVYFVCRRLRIAHLLPALAADDAGDPYDYDTRVLYVAHFAARNASLEDSIVDQMGPFPGITPSRPMDAVIVGDHLFVADGGEGERLSAVHIWRLSYRVEILTPEQQRLKRIFG
ncbi:MAG: hypothetical protein IPK19_08470 [Chloroflexi bacterium]|nr:hypothetical protein [Chloroflexota bacterium]